MLGRWVRLSFRETDFLVFRLALRRVEEGDEDGGSREGGGMVVVRGGGGGDAMGVAAVE
jgi:hypothetical protein